MSAVLHWLPAEVKPEVLVLEHQAQGPPGPSSHSLPGPHLSVTLPSAPSATSLRPSPGRPQMPMFPRCTSACNPWLHPRSVLYPLGTLISGTTSHTATVFCSTCQEDKPWLLVPGLPQHLGPTRTQSLFSEGVKTCEVRQNALPETV